MYSEISFTQNFAVLISQHINTSGQQVIEYLSKYFKNNITEKKITEYFKWKLFVSQVDDSIYYNASYSLRDGIDTTESMSWWQSMLGVNSADSTSVVYEEDIKIREGDCIVSKVNNATRARMWHSFVSLTSRLIVHVNYCFLHHCVHSQRKYGT